MSPPTRAMTLFVALSTLLAAGCTGSPAQVVRSALAAGHTAEAWTAADHALAEHESTKPDAHAERAELARSLAEAFDDHESAETAAHAIDLLDRAVRPWRRAPAGSEVAIAELLHDLSNRLYDAGRLDEAERDELDGLHLLEGLPERDEAEIAARRADIALIRVNQGRPDEAEQDLLAAIPVLEAAKRWEDLVYARTTLARVYRIRAEFEQAANVQKQAVAEADLHLAGDSATRADLYNSMAMLERTCGHLAEAERYLRDEQRLLLAQPEPETESLATLTLNLAELLRFQSRPLEAERLYDDARRLAATVFGETGMEMFQFYNQSAVHYQEQSEPERANSMFQKALEVANNLQDPDHPFLAQALNDSAMALRDDGRCDLAMPQLDQALAIRTRTLGADHPDTAAILVNQAECMTRDGRHDDARRRVEAAIPILDASEAQPEIGLSAHLLHSTLVRSSAPYAARQELEKAFSQIVALRTERGGGERARAEFTARYLKDCDRLVHWEIEDGQPLRALAFAERSRAQALLDQLSRASVGPFQHLDEATTQRLRNLRLERQALREERARHTESDAGDDAIQRLDKRIYDVDRQFTLLHDEIRNADPAWRQAEGHEPPTAAQVQRALLSADSILLDYYVGSENAYLFVVDRANHGVRVESLTVPPDVASSFAGVTPGPLTRESLAQLVDAFESSPLRQQIGPGRSVTVTDGTPSKRPVSPEPDALLHALWRVLMPAKTWQQVRHAADVVIIPDGALNHLPFELLRDPSGYWIDEAPGAVRYVPSLATMDAVTRRALDRPKASGILSIAYPLYSDSGALWKADLGDLEALDDVCRSRTTATAAAPGLALLPGTACEALRLVDAFRGVEPVQVLVGPNATEAAFRASANGKRLLHLATHGVVSREGSELLARFELTAPQPGRGTPEDDGTLELFELYDLELDADLAVLSTCESHEGVEVPGEGVFTLSRGMLVAGASRVVATLWKVDDHCTPELMGTFFRDIAAFEREGRSMDYGKALRHAKEVIRERPECDDPRFWAAFVMAGER
jgi:CHAT domain-containing protein